MKNCKICRQSIEDEKDLIKFFNPSERGDVFYHRKCYGAPHAILDENGIANPPYPK